MGDEGLPVGGALLIYCVATANVYLGRDYDLKLTAHCALRRALG